jgi:selenide,water dikinase
MSKLENAPVRLTELARGGGCACKLPASELSALLGAPVASGDPRVLVGNETLDDAACFAVSDDGTAIVQTVDFFTPIVDDPETFGRIAATNAISDIYAMGGTPLFALALGGFPAELSGDVVAAILRGGQDAAAGAGIAILGGHTIVAPEPIYGLTVTGTVQADAVWRNSGARDGDVLVLTKSIGTGVIANALQAGNAPDGAIEAAVASMTTLNRDAALALRALGPHAVTDVTGFGLVGHAHELAAASGVEVELDSAALPLLPYALELVRQGRVPGGSRRNREAADAYASFDATIEPALALLACDAQTSGGLLAALPEDRAHGIGTIVGRVRSGIAGRVVLR